MLDGLPSNGLPLSCAAMIHRDHVGVEIARQNGRRVWAAQRRPLEWRVGRPALRTLDHADTSAKLVGRAGYGGEARRGVVGYGVWVRRAGRARQEREGAPPEWPHVHFYHNVCGPPNELRISRRKRAAYESAKIATISRAKRSDCMRVLGRALLATCYYLTILGLPKRNSSYFSSNSQYRLSPSEVRLFRSFRSITIQTELSS